MLLSATFRTQFELDFTITLENAFFRGLILKPTESIGSSKKRYYGFLALFMWQSLEILNVFNTLTLEYHFLVESTMTKNVLFQYKTVTSEANVKRNRMVSTKWTCHKEQFLIVTTSFFLKILFHYKNLF